MQTFQASVRVRVDGRSQIVQTQIRAPNSNDARWLLWAQFGFHSITSGPRGPLVFSAITGGTQTQHWRGGGVGSSLISLTFLFTLQTGIVTAN